MKLMILLGLALAATQAGAVPETVAVDTAPVESTDAIADPAPAGAVLPLPGARSFVCEDGHMILLSHDQAAGLLRGIRGGEPFTLQQQVSRRGLNRFVDGSDSIILAGDTALLNRRRDVRQSCIRVPDQPMPGILWGQVNVPADAHLPTGSLLKVLLVDASRDDAPAVEIASTVIRASDNQAPFWFLIRYDAERTLQPARPRVQAWLRTGKSGDKGSRLIISETPVAIPDDGSAAPSPIELELAAARHE